MNGRHRERHRERQCERISDQGEGERDRQSAEQGEEAGPEGRAGGRDQQGFLAAVHRLAWADTGELRCEVTGHPDGHVCLALPAEGVSLAAVREALSGRYGHPRNLAMDGYADPTLTRRTGLPLLTPFGERLVEMRAWTHAGRWIGCGTLRSDDGIRPVVLVAEGQEPTVDVPEGSSWVDGVVAVTGQGVSGMRSIDWAETETRLGTALPSDYKQLVELFGHGAFDEYLELHVPGAGFRSSDLVRNAEWLREWAAGSRSGLWDPYELYPAPGGLLQWGSTEQADQFFWLTEGSDPDRWPVLVTEDVPDSWVRFDGTTAEFIYRMLTDRRHPFSTARYFDRHWFASYEREE
ncbi:SMI1/KNR4 family protein [Streptomyces sp. RS10V-4]|uniref:SMI1/KNR4 family protein n=1 Tax=Streptomyces rhizoryzae TaxID=2932493 RepID=UPI0020063332|nr:SMI1/KNR4 family protein [Streptomyces rhizoryzae]MCK7622435.1 SMI1/KNR4 family protein [Streptomyces rhizoryzae]